jgi:hypothetical protein
MVRSYLTEKYVNLKYKVYDVILSESAVSKLEFKLGRTGLAWVSCDSLPIRMRIKNKRNNL